MKSKVHVFEFGFECGKSKTWEKDISDTVEYILHNFVMFSYEFRIVQPLVNGKAWGELKVSDKNPIERFASKFIDWTKEGGAKVIWVRDITPAPKKARAKATYRVKIIQK